MADPDRRELVRPHVTHEVRQQLLAEMRPPIHHARQQTDFDRYVVAIAQYHHRILQPRHPIDSERTEFHWERARSLRRTGRRSRANLARADNRGKRNRNAPSTQRACRRASFRDWPLPPAAARRQRGSRRRDEIDQCPPRRKTPPRPARPNRPTHHAARAASPANSFEGGGARMVRQLLRDLGGESW